ncbi:hypothetical protein PROFUN_08403 [Planoprotostelium fungivorum]|uniref:Uncharacterized protein n=1 Tax=Planoprotostelium fungivorum TaxID=1890364 RepID=A0A2P6NJR8_9EUKA|nr:hypothetical protein PROFUN_08403 [Planoprotostelium fungivorum]
MSAKLAKSPVFGLQVQNSHLSFSPEAIIRTFVDKIMKRHKPDVATNSPEELALEILRAMDAALVIHCTSEGECIIFTNDSTKEMLPHFVTNIHQSQRDPSNTPDEVAHFWTTVRSVATTGIITKEDFKLETNVTAKFRKATILEQTYVVITVKKTKEQDQISRFLNHGPADENLISYLSDAVENDIIGLTLGMGSLYISLSSDMWEPGVTTYYAICPNTATACGIVPWMARGKTTADLNRSKPDIIQSAKKLEANLDPVTQRSSYSIETTKNATMHVEVKRISPKLHLSVLLVRKHKEKTRPKLPSNAKGVVDHVYRKNQWEAVLENVLEWVNDNLHHASTKRLKIPDEFFEDTQNIFCYIYTNAESFLPSRSADGFQWKSSYSAPSQSKLQKRYFYHKTEGPRMRRRVMWIDKLPHLQIIEYRHLDYHGDIPTDHLIGPEMMKWSDVISQVTDREDHKLHNTMDEIDREFSMGSLRGEVPYEDIQESTQVLSYVSGILNNWAVRHRAVQSSAPPL